MRSSSARASSGGQDRGALSPVMMVIVFAAMMSCALTLLHHRSIWAVPPRSAISRTGTFFDPRIGLASSTSSRPNGKDWARASEVMHNAAVTATTKLNEVTNPRRAPPHILPAPCLERPHINIQDGRQTSHVHDVQWRWKRRESLPVFGEGGPRR